LPGRPDDCQDRCLRKLSKLEDAALRVIAAQNPDANSAIDAQRSVARVTGRNNTGAGFYATFEVAQSCPVVMVASPIGDVTARMQGLDHGMGFILWLQNGRLSKLEGYSFEEYTARIDLEAAVFDLDRSRHRLLRVIAHVGRGSTLEPGRDSNVQGRSHADIQPRHYRRACGDIVAASK
jgi:hypothetical protein